jgi:hypothetical protein
MTGASGKRKGKKKESIVGLPGRISEQIAIGVRITW